MDPKKFTAFNVLEDEALRQGMINHLKQHRRRENVLMLCWYRHQRILGVANDTTVICRQGVCWRM